MYHISPDAGLVRLELAGRYKELELVMLANELRIDPRRCQSYFIIADIRELYVELDYNNMKRVANAMSGAFDSKSGVIFATQSDLQRMLALLIEVHRPYDRPFAVIDANSDYQRFMPSKVKALYPQNLHTGNSLDR